MLFLKFLKNHTRGSFFLDVNAAIAKKRTKISYLIKDVVSVLLSDQFWGGLLVVENMIGH